MLPLLQAKFFPPLVERSLVGRARLSAQFLGRLPRKLTLVTAPPGYGKTSVMAQMQGTLHAQQQRCVWLSIDASDNDFSQLVRYLVGAVERVFPGFGEPVLVLLQGGLHLARDTILRVLANALSTLAGPLFIFIEDAHELSDERARGALRELIRGTPPHIRFVISSRAHCDLDSARLRATGQLSEIQAEDLRFTHGEIAEYFVLANDLALGPQAIEQLLLRTEGWAAALQLTSLALRNTDTLSALLTRLDAEEQGLAAYLAEDVLRHLPEDLRAFLLAVGGLRRICVALCDALIGTHTSAACLRRIEAANLFISASEGTRRWYRFHPLFSAFLRRQRERELPGALAAIQARASQWFEAEGVYDEAVDYALQAGALEQAARVLNEHAYDLWRGGHQSRLDGWARQIPPAMRRRYPKLRLIQAWSLMLAGKIAAATRILDEVGHEMESSRNPPALANALRGDLLFMRLMVAYYQEDIAEAERLCERWLGGEYHADPFLLGAVKSVLAGVRGLYFELAYAEAEAGTIADLLAESGTSYGPIWSYSILGAIFLGVGRLAEAMTLIALAVDSAVRIGGAATPLAALPASLLALAHYERNELTSAQNLIDQYAAISERLNFVDHQISSFLVPARLHEAAGDDESALALIEEQVRTTHAKGPLPTRITTQLTYERVRLLTRLGRAARLRALIREEGLDAPCANFAPPARSAVLLAVRALARVRAGLARGEVRAALALARQWIRHAQERRLPRPEVLFRLLAALALLSLEEVAAAQRELRAALLVAAPHTLVRVFLDEGQALRAPLQIACSALHASDPGLSSFLALLRLALEDHPQPRVAVRVVAVSGRLSPREHEVLGLVAAGLSNRETGARLGLTENTVKWYLQQVFQKLAVRRRAQAVAVARDGGWLR